MKIMMIEATAEELKANKRIMDSVVDAFSNFIDSMIRCKEETYEENSINDSNDICADTE